MKRLALAVVVLTLATGCGSRVRNWDEQLAAQQQSTPVTNSTEAGNDGPEDRGDTTETTGRTTGDRTGRTTTTARSVANIGPIPSPKPGVYIYDESSEGTDDDGTPQRQTSVSRETWAVISASRTEVISTSTRRGEGKDDEGASRTTKLRTTPDKQVVVSSTDSYESEDEDQSVCTYKPVLTRVMLPLKVGTSWQAESSCESDGIKQKVTSTARISGEADDVIGRKRVHTFVITATETVTQTFENETTDPTAPEGEPVTFGYTIKRTSHIDATSLLTVLDDEEIQIRFEAFDGEDAEEVTDVVKVHRQLRSLTPR